ncbi:MAG: hypothetical protein WCK96_12755 [Methylococcales bacterium]
MNFINPFDLLEVETTDNDAIKKAKRRKLADIELNDGFLEIGNQKISRSEFIKLVDELDDNKTKNMYFFIKKNIHLNELLLNNDVKFFYLYQPHKAYQNQDFINFVSPYFAESFSQLLLKAFKTGNNAIVDKLFSVPLLVNQEYTDKLYKNLSRLLNEQIDELRDISPNDKNINSIENNCKSVANIELLNSLPDFFQKQRNDIAMELRNIAIRVYNFRYTQISYNIVCYAQRIKIDGLIKIKVQKEVEEINELNEKEKQAKTDKLIFDKWEKIFLELIKITENFESGVIGTNGISTTIEQLFSVDELNKLPHKFEDIRHLIALKLRNLSVDIWNKFNAKSALSVISISHKINIKDTALKEKITDDFNTLRHKIQLESDYNKNDEKESISMISIGLLLVLVLCLIWLNVKNNDNLTTNLSSIKKPVDRHYDVGSENIANSKAVEVTSSRKGTTDFSKDISITQDDLNPYKINKLKNGWSSFESTAPNIATNTEEATNFPENEAVQKEVISPYKGNQLKDGESPFDACFGKGIYVGEAWITFYNGNQTDVIVTLADNFTERVVRNEYIRAGNSFTMKKIPAGTYYLKVVHGNDWNPEIINSCGTKGSFETNLHYSKSDNLTTINNNEYSYTTGEITLYTVKNGNMKTQSSNDSEFFNKNK